MKTLPWREAFRETLPLGAIALAVTLLRLTGERLGWSETWFSRATGGVVPSGVGWVVGITWLALPFGIWLAARLVARGRPPDYADIPQAQQLPLWAAFTALALVPQLVFWVAFTVVAGMVTGTLTAALLSRRPA